MVGMATSHKYLLNLAPIGEHGKIMKTPKTVAELKRILVVGQKIECTLFEGKIPKERMRGIGEIAKVQTNGVYIERGKCKHRSWLDFPKASEYEPLFDGYFNINDISPRQYKLLVAQSCK